MYNRSGIPAWRRDAKWLSAILLVLSLAPALAFFSLAQLASPAGAVPLIERVLQLAVFPEGTGETTLAARRDAGYLAGEPLELLPGSGAYAEVPEVTVFTTDDARERVASVLAWRVVEGGEGAVTGLALEQELLDSLQAAFSGPAAALARAELATALRGTGIFDGRRLADWPLQAERNPGEPVQPVVGLFVHLPPDELEGLDAAPIGERVVAALADLTLTEGAGAVVERAGNPEIRRRLEEALRGPLRLRLQELFSTLLVAHEAELGERLAQARSVLDGTAGRAAGAAGLATPEELRGRSPQEANALLLRRLAERGYRGGSAALAEMVIDPAQAARASSAAPFVDALSAEARTRYARRAWMLAGAATLFLVLLLLASSGWSRLFNLGLALVAAAAIGTLASALLLGGLRRAGVSPPPGTMGSEGAIAHFAALVAYLAGSVPIETLTLFARNHLALLAIGAALIALSLAGRLFRFVRPRRRRSLL